MFENIRLKNFRNYAETEICLKEGINSLVGRNGLGKTNFLEAVFVLCEGRPLRARRWDEVIKKGEIEAEVEARYTKEGSEYLMKARIDEDGLKRDVFNLSRNLSAVALLPDDLVFLKGGPEERRREIDLCLSKIRPGYGKDLSDFMKVIRQRNEVLRGIKTGTRSVMELNQWNILLMELGERLVRDRLDFLRDVCDVMENILGKLGRESFGFKYYSSLKLSKKGEVREFLGRMQAAEVRRGQTLVGPHRDEIVFSVEGRNTRRESSQGEQKLVTLAWKLTVEEFLRRKGYDVILLFDDCLSELDDHNAEMVLRVLEDRDQVLITDAVGRRQLYRYHVLDMEEIAG